MSKEREQLTHRLRVCESCGLAHEPRDKGQVGDERRERRWELLSRLPPLLSLEELLEQLEDGYEHIYQMVDVSRRDLRERRCVVGAAACWGRWWGRWLEALARVAVAPVRRAAVSVRPGQHICAKELAAVVRVRPTATTELDGHAGIVHGKESLKQPSKEVWAEAARCEAAVLELGLEFRHGQVVDLLGGERCACPEVSARGQPVGGAHNEEPRLGTDLGRLGRCTSPKQPKVLWL